MTYNGQKCYVCILQTPGANAAGYGFMLTSHKMGFNTELSVKCEPVLAACSCLITGSPGLFFLLVLLRSSVSLSCSWFERMRLTTH